MKKIIDDYWLNRHIIQMPKKLTRPDRANYANLLIAEVNDYDCANLSDEYIWRAKSPKGQATVSAIMNILPQNAKYLYLIYTNSLKGNRLIRMTQEVWAFPDLDTAKTYFSQMVQELRDVKHSHLIGVKLTKNKFADKLLDYYYFNDNTALIDKGERYALVATQAKAINRLPRNITFEQFEQVSAYQRQLFGHDLAIVQSGLTKKLRQENKELVKKRHQLIQTLGVKRHLHH